MLRSVLDVVWYMKTALKVNTAEAIRLLQLPYLPLQANMDKVQVYNRFCVGNMIVNAGLLVGSAAGARNIDELIDNSFFRDYILAELDRRGKYLLFLG